MSIGSTIKRLRREKDITQEQLAEYLGITSRAVSQWECDRTAPDISQIPALCHIFNVTSDVLLGIDMARINEAIQKYLDEARDEECKGNFEGSTDILCEAHRNFPKSYQIMQKLANAMVCVYVRKGIGNYDEPIRLCNRILAECTDSMTRYEAISTLGTAYAYAGKTEEMHKLAGEMPRAEFSYENFMRYHWQGDGDFRERQEYIAYLINLLADEIYHLTTHCHDNGTPIYSTEERIRLNEMQVRFLELLFPDGDFRYAAQYGELASSQTARLCLRGGDMEQAWMWLKRAADFAIHMDTYDFNACHASLPLRGYCDGGWIMEAEGNRSQAMLNWLISSGEFAALRSDARFDALVCRLKKTAKKP